jgi:hypothetical protein
MNTYGLTKGSKNQEEKIIAELLKNEYPPQVEKQIHIQYEKTDGLFLRISPLV